MPIPTINYPTSIDDAASLFAPFNIYFWKSFLKVACDASETTLTLTDGDDLLDIPDEVVGNFIGIDSEIMFVESVNNTGADKTITVIRGCGHSTAANHIIGSLVQQTFTAELHNQLSAAIIAIETQVGTSPFSSSTITLSPDSDTYDYTFTGHKGFIYDIIVSAKDLAGSNKSTIIHRINHWNDNTNPPETVEEFLSFIGSGVSSEVLDLVAGQETMVIRINNCNGGSAKVTVKVLGEVL